MFQTGVFFGAYFTNFFPRASITWSLCLQPLGLIMAMAHLISLNCPNMRPEHGYLLTLGLQLEIVCGSLHAGLIDLSPTGLSRLILSGLQCMRVKE